MSNIIHRFYIFTLALIHERARREYKANLIHDSVTTITVTDLQCVRFSRDRFTAGQQRVLENRVEELPCRVVRVATDTAIEW